MDDSNKRHSVTRHVSEFAAEEAIIPERRIRLARFMVVLALLGTMLAAAGWFQPASAGTGSSATCNNGYGEAAGHIEIPLITQPTTLALEIPDPTQGQPINHVRLCYSTSRSGYSGPDTTGGSITVYPDSYWNSVRCSPQGNMGNVAPVSCYASPRWGAEGVITRTCGSAIRSEARRTFLVETKRVIAGGETPAGRNADVESTC